MKKKSSLYTLFWSLLVILEIYFSVNAKADPVVSQVFTQQESPSVMWYVKNIQGELTDAEVSVEESQCEVAAFGAVSSQEEIVYKTVILLDNSLSISESNRVKAKALISQIIQNHADREEFVLYTFSTQLSEVASGNDYDHMLGAVDGIRFENQDAYLIECLAAVLENLSQDEAKYYHRIILISDGVDDNLTGPTFAELMDMVESDTYRCPIYTIVSLWERDKSGVKNLSALSRRVDAQTFVLDECEEVSEILSQIDEDYKSYFFMFDVPLKEKDGMSKQMQLQVNTAQGTFLVTYMMTMPTLTSEEQLEMQETQTESEIQEEEPKQRLLIIEQDETDVGETEERPEESFLEKNFPVIFMALIVILIFAMAAILLLVMHRKKSAWNEGEHLSAYNPERDENEKTRYEPREKQQSNEDRISGEIEEKSHSGKTVGMWDSVMGSNSGKNIILNEIGSHTRHDFILRDEILIGRDNLCTVVLKDKLISRKHCRLIMREEETLVEDLGSRNGTYVNGELIAEPRNIKSGDVLKIGKTELKVGIL